MRRFIIISTVVFLAAGLARAEVTASLEVVAGQGVSAGPYRRAELAVTNSAATAIETVLLKPVGIGLTVRYELTVPPGATGRQIVFLPAISPAQEYALTALDASGEAIARTSASITWPAELVTADAFIDDAFRAWTDEPARWSAKTRWNYLLVLAMFVTAAAATLLIRRPMLRVVAVVVIAAATTALIVLVLIPAGPGEVRVYRYTLLLHNSAGEVESDLFAVLSARRTTLEQSGKIGPLPSPVWPDRAAAVNDDVSVKPGTGNKALTGTIELTLRPGLVRIIRPGWRRPDANESVIIPDVTTPRHGWVLRNSSGFTVRAYPIPDDTLLIRNDSVWRIRSATDYLKGHQASVRANQAKSYWAFMCGEGGENLNLHARRLLDYWRNRHQQSGEVYLVYPEDGQNGARIEVVRLKETPSVATTTSAAVTTRPRPLPLQTLQ